MSVKCIRCKWLERGKRILGDAFLSPDGSEKETGWLQGTNDDKSAQRQVQREGEILHVFTPLDVRLDDLPHPYEKRVSAPPDSLEKKCIDDTKALRRGYAYERWLGALF